MEIKQARFVISVADKEKILTEEIPEIAVAGKSNVGKSSFINFMTNNGKLAKTSSTPGKTRLINYFEINKGEFMLVDLPGYGFAKVTDAEKAKWAKLMEGYILESCNLANVFILVDVRHEPTALDKQMVNFLQYYTIPFTVIATKCDKLSRAQISRRKREIAAAFAMGEGNIITVSSLTKVGKEAVLDRIEQVITHFLPRSGEEDTDA